MCRYFHRPLEPGLLAACPPAQTPLYVRPPWSADGPSSLANTVKSSV
jgi:hypothetical protein